MISPVLMFFMAITLAAMFWALFTAKNKYLVMVFSILFSAIVMATIITSRPQAIDVYRGKTELKIEYNNEKADTIVIWKTLID